MEWFIIVPNSLAACCAIGQAAACMILPIRNHNLDPFLAEEGAIVIKEDDKATKCKV